tara:strand:- start:183 stop:419 length:237 start_codon:yes stop_codon:yes gene_type:complete
MIKTIFVLSIGFFGGLLISWPGIKSRDNWSCAMDVINKSSNNSTDLRALMAVSPKYLVKREEQGKLSKIRIVADACFR